ncbi:sugar transferase [Cellulomonas triticagri]|uniref:Sugar transferase n=1 Tax=Cellulomonas triticagri TaxID=2483352 RepID=A0A3M2IVM0_9CELL|nr:sugar transferase [Cellulomonas triticagri]RMI05139.1 sugar transferase [Cellulomonas triticagri]
MSLLDDHDVSRSAERTVAATGDPQPVDHDAERRRSARGPRLSWASDRPFYEPRGTAEPSGWRSQHATYQIETLARDTVLATCIPTLLLFLLHGVSLLQLSWGVLIGLLFIAFTAVERGYDRQVLGDGHLEFEAVIRGGVLTAAALAVFAVGADVDVPRTIVFAALPLVVLVLIVARHVARRALHRRRDHGEAMRRTLVVGDATSITHVVDDLSGLPQHGYHIAGVCVPSFDGPLPGVGVPVLGTVSDVVQVAVDGEFDVVIVTGSELSGQALRRLSWALQRTRTELVVAPGIVEVFGPRVSLEPTAGLSLIHVNAAESRRSRLVAKQVFDTAFALGALLLLAPVLAVIALAVKITSPGPVLFQQTRIGKEGREFSMLKFRSMVVDAEERLAELRAANQADGPLFKMDRDPRITRIGHFLRKHSLDELPQLINVVRGEMALVGPRPPLAHEVAQYRESARRRLLVKPGLTGLWQISGRADLAWEDAVKLDLRYVENWSIAFDLMILWRTVHVVVSGHGGR